MFAEVVSTLLYTRTSSTFANVIGVGREANRQQFAQVAVTEWKLLAPNEMESVAGEQVAQPSNEQQQTSVNEIASTWVGKMELQSNYYFWRTPNQTDHHTAPTKGHSRQSDQTT